MEFSCRTYEWPWVAPYTISVPKDQDDVFVSWILNQPEPDALVELMTKLCRPGSRFIDLGANVGYFTLAAASAGARVLAVEALPSNYVALVNSVKQNRYRDVTAVHSAVFSEDGVLSMAGHSAWAHVSTGDGGVQVPSLTLDTLTAAYNFRDCGLMKMDVEGAELDVIAGAPEFLAGNRDFIILFEANAFSAMSFRYGIPDLLRKFEEKQFKLYLVHGRQLVPRTSRDLQEGNCVDYLAVRGEMPQVDGFTVGEMAEEERIRALLGQVQYPAYSTQAYIRWIEPLIPEWLRRSPVLSAALDKLCSDTDEALISHLRVFNGMPLPGHK